MAVTTTEPAAASAATSAAPLRARRLKLPRSPKVLIGLGLLIAFLLLAVIGPLIAPFNPSADLAASGTRSCRACPASRWRSGSWCPARC